MKLSLKFNLLFLALLLPFNLHAFFGFFGGGGSSDEPDGSSSKPYTLVVNGDKRNDDYPTKYYSFYSSINQVITVNITDHYTYDDLTLTLYNLLDSGECGSSVLDTSPTTDGEFTWDTTTHGGTNYCLKIAGSGYYDVKLTADATPLKVGVSDTSASESNTSIDFIFAMTTAHDYDINIDYVFTDDSAVIGTNYTDLNGATTQTGTISIAAGSQAATLLVPLIDTSMSTTKTFSLSISQAKDSQGTDIEVSETDITATGTIIGSNSVTDGDDGEYEGPDICYDSRESSGFCMFGSCMFYKERTNVRSMVNGLENVGVKKSLTRGLAFMNIGPGVGTNDEEKTLGSGDDEAEEKAFADSDFNNDGYYNASMFPKGYEYRIGTGANATDGGDMQKDETSSYYDKALFKFGFFTQYTNIVKYEKNGQVYEEVLQACNPDTHGSLDEKPVVSGCGVFMDALNSHDEIIFNTPAGVWQTINYTSENDLNTPSIQNSNGTALCSGVACKADNIGSSKITLPTFLSSQKVDNISVPYSMVIAKQHVGSLILNNDANTQENEEERTIVFEAPYSSSYGSRVMLINGINDNLTNEDMLHHYVFKEGDYWIKNWDIDTQNNVTIETVGDVRFFIEGGFNITSAILKIGHSGSQDSDKFYMYLYNNFTTDVTGATAIQNGYIYSKGTLSLGSTSTIALDWGAITSDGELSIDNGAPSTFNYYAPTGDENSGFAVLCDSGGGYSTGLFDAWDDDVEDDTLPASANRILKTKIVNQAFNISLASINSNNNAYELKAGTGNVDVGIYIKNTSTQIADTTISYDPSSNDHIDSVSFNVPTITQDAVVGFKVCASYDEDGVMTLSEGCSGDVKSCEYLSTTPTWRVCHSSDNFAIRPYAFKVFGLNQYKRAGDDFNVSIKAVDISNYNINTGVPADVSGVNDYNISLSNLDITSSFYVPTPAETTLMQSNTGTSDIATCPNPGSFANINSADTFANGEAEANLIFTETGVLDLIVSERVGSEFALVDADDTSSATRLIQTSNITYDKEDISKSILFAFIPYQFQTSAEYNTTSTKEWVYINDINASNSTFTTPNMAAMIKYSIIAQDKFGSKVHNYTNTCFPDTDPACPQRNGLKLNTTFDLFLDAKINSTQAINISFYTQDSAGVAIFTLNKQASYTSGENNIQEWISPKNFTQGEGNATVYFNIDRDINATRNPVSITLVDANTSTSWMSNPGSPKAFNGTSVNTAKTFIYGRTHASRQRYVGASGNANIYYEVFCSNSIGTTCNTSLLNVVSPNKKRVDDSRWYINEDHNSTSSDGVIGTLNGALVNSSTVSDGNIAVRTLTYTGSTYPYRTTMKNNASKWLIYDKDNSVASTNKFKVEFENANTGWSGQHETNTTTDDSGQANVNRRSMW